MPVDSVGASSTVLPAPTRGAVVHVADGDTFALHNGQRVRIIGIDSPEEYFGNHDCGSKLAAAVLRRLLPARATVTLRSDAIQPSRDRYGRLLRYVATSHARDIGLALRPPCDDGATQPTCVCASHAPHGQSRTTSSGARHARQARRPAHRSIPVDNGLLRHADGKLRGIEVVQRAHTEPRRNRASAAGVHAASASHGQDPAVIQRPYPSLSSRFGLARASAYEEIWLGSRKIRRPVAAI